MRKFQKAAISFFIVVAVSIAGLVVWIGPRWQTPLGPPLQIYPTVTPFGLPATWTPDANATATRLASSTLDPVSQASPLPTITPNVGLCGAPPVMNILVVGSDQRGESYSYGLADVIRLVRVDFVNPRVTVLEIPRDLWVEIPDIADNLNGQDHEKLNQAYLYGNRGFGYTNDPAQGPGLLSRTLTLNFGTQIDHYAAVNMKTFVKIVNAVGGIDVYLPKAVDGRTAEDRSQRLVFPEGEHHLDGDRALTLARIRISGVFNREENQDRVICALRDKLASPSVVTKIPDLIKSFRDSVQTDLSPAQLGQLACISTQIDPENIRFATFPQELFAQTRIYDPVFKARVFVWDVDYDVLRDYIEQFHAGTWPPISGTPENDKEEVPFCP
ncbi:MAG: LCP family protein [Chloroflexi bacterium]|nr:LCP family protein [Chloroflexota bacterium]